jgi:DNA-binding CsgD family transcriptional regulator
VALVAAARGDIDVAASLCDEMLQWAQPRGVRAVMAYAHHTMAVAALGQRDFETAYRHAREASPPGEIEPALAHALWLMLDLVDAAVHSNRRAEARAHVDAMRAAHVERLSSRYALILAGCEAKVAAPEQAPAAFERALAMPEAERWPFELARLQLDYGEHLRRSRLHSRARSRLLAALDGFTVLQAGPWAARARSELDASSSPRRTEQAAGLTARELEVATLAASGLTNAQIGLRLGASPRTVAAHLSRTLSKLQLSSRAGLRDALRPRTDDQ